MCFNPRPPSMAGDPGLRLPDFMRLEGFNPRPPSMAGDPGWSRKLSKLPYAFQSAPAIDGGRSPCGH